MNYKIDLLSSIDEIKKFKKKWFSFEKSLSDSEYNYSFIINWLESFLEKKDSRFGFEKEILVVVLYRNQSIISIYPLLKVKRIYKRFFRYSSVEFIGSQFGGGNLGGIGLINNDQFKIILNWLNENISFDVLYLSNQNKGHLSIYSSLKSFSYSVYPIINLKDFDDYTDYSIKKYNSNMRKNLRRRLKMFYSDGGCIESKKYKDISENEFNQILKVSASKETEGKHDHFKDKEILYYLKNMLLSSKNKIIFAKLKNVIIGYQIIYLYDKFKIYSGLSYDRNYKKYGIGNILEDFDIKSTNFKEYNYISMGPGLEKYKKYFS